MLSQSPKTLLLLFCFGFFFVFFYKPSKYCLNFLVFTDFVELHPSGFATWVKKKRGGVIWKPFFFLTHVDLQQNHPQLLKKAAGLSMLPWNPSNSAKNVLLDKIGAERWNRFSSVWGARDRLGFYLRRTVGRCRGNLAYGSFEGTQPH